MKTITNRYLVCFGLAGVMALGIWSSVQAQAANPNEEMYRSEGAKEDAQMMESSPSEMPAGMAQKQDMMAKMRAQDTELAELTAQMNAAPADQKVDLMAALITKMVEQRAGMHAHMEMMQENRLRCMPMDKDGKPNPKCPMMSNEKE